MLLIKAIRDILHIGIGINKHCYHFVAETHTKFIIFEVCFGVHITRSFCNYLTVQGTMKSKIESIQYCSSVH